MTKRNPLPSYERVRALFDYNKRSGILRWKVKRASKKIGDIAGLSNPEKARYARVGVDRKIYRTHLIIWLWVTGKEPVDQIDHKDTIKTNNRWANLREATKSQNMANIGLIKSNRSGYRGVSRYRQGDDWGKGWQSAIKKDGKFYHVGHFATAIEAHRAYQKKYKELFGEFARI